MKKSAKKGVKKALKKVVKKVVPKESRVTKKATKKVIKKSAKKITPKRSPGTKKVVAKKAIKKVVKKKVAPKKVVVKKATPKGSIVTKKPIVKNVVIKKPAAKGVAAVKAVPKVNVHSTHLNVGDKAPFFEGVDQKGNTLSSYSMAGKTIVLYFYPKDNTDGCTAEACSLRDEYYFLGSNNYAIIGVSADTQESHAQFAEKHSLPFPLIADTNMDIIKAFDVWGTKQLAGRVYDGIVRTTFIIGADGMIKHIIKDVNTKEHAKQILAL